MSPVNSTVSVAAVVATATRSPGARLVAIKRRAASLAGFKSTSLVFRLSNKSVTKRGRGRGLRFRGGGRSRSGSMAFARRREILDREGRDGLDLAGVGNLEIVARESGHCAVVAVADHDGDFDQFHMSAQDKDAGRNVGITLGAYLGLGSRLSEGQPPERGECYGNLHPEISASAYWIPLFYTRGHGFELFWV